jgi:hypothetical protein
MNKATILGILLLMGLPFLHGVTGRDWGMAVKGLATSEPGAVAQHIQDTELAPGGMPAAHGVDDGRDWGYAVSMLAQHHPGAVAHHIHM